MSRAHFSMRGENVARQSAARNTLKSLPESQETATKRKTVLAQFLEQQDIKPASATIQSLLYALMNATESREEAPLHILSINDDPGGTIRLIITAETTDDNIRRRVITKQVNKTITDFTKYHRAEPENVYLKPMAEDESEGMMISGAELAALNGNFQVETIDPQQIQLQGVSINYASEKTIRMTERCPRVQVLLGLDDPYSFSYKNAYQSGELTQLATISIKNMGIYIGSTEGDAGADF